MELPRNAIFGNILYASSESEVDSDYEEYLSRERREYKMLPRVVLDRYDETDHKCRYRFLKTGTSFLIDLIENDLPFDPRRSRELRPEHKVLIALRFYAVGSVQQVCFIAIITIC